MAGVGDYKPLRLLVADAGDLTVLSTVLQDSIAKVRDFAHVPARRRFAFVANRFVWEEASDKKRGPFARVRAGCHFDDVISVRHLNLRPDARDGVLALLAIRFEPGEDGAGVVLLDFAGGGAIRLEVESLNAQLADISAPWVARTRPEHEL